MLFTAIYTHIYIHNKMAKQDKNRYGLGDRTAIRVGETLLKHFLDVPQQACMSAYRKRETTFWNKSRWESRFSLTIFNDRLGYRSFLVIQEVNKSVQNIVTRILNAITNFESITNFECPILSQPREYIDIKASIDRKIPWSYLNLTIFV